METLELREIRGRQIAFAFHDAGTPRIAILCHGFRSSMIGPNRFFVRLARDLVEARISVFRFDQYGSGNSEGSFVDSSFENWVEAITAVSEEYLSQGNRVALLGQSMGGAAVLCAAASLGGHRLAGVAAWVPGMNAVDLPPLSPDQLMEEGGQQVRAQYWYEAKAADIPGAFTRIEVPTAVWLATEDEFVSPEHNDLLIRAARQHQTIRVLQGFSHSSWTVEEAEVVLTETAAFLRRSLDAGVQS